MSDATNQHEQRIPVPPFSGTAFELHPGQRVTVIDDEGGQVVDFFAESLTAPEETLSSGVTIDCNESLALKVGDILYSTHYRPMFEMVEDTVEEHDLFHPSCRPEMYDFFYGNGEGHPSCLDNLNKALGRERNAITPVNLFMHTTINPDHSISVEEPLSKAGDHVTLEALMPLRVAVAACSVTESKCNSGRATSVTVVVHDSPRLG